MENTIDHGDRDAGGAGRLVRALALTAAVVMQVIVLVPFTVASGLVAPLWALVALYAVWLVGAGVLALAARHRPLVAPVVPLVNAAVLWAAISVGELWLGWTP